MGLVSSGMGRSSGFDPVGALTGPVLGFGNSPFGFWKLLPLPLFPLPLFPFPLGYPLLLLPFPLLGNPLPFPLQFPLLLGNPLPLPFPLLGYPLPLPLPLGLPLEFGLFGLVPGGCCGGGPCAKSGNAIEAVSSAAKAIGFRGFIVGSWPHSLPKGFRERQGGGMIFDTAFPPSEQGYAAACRAHAASAVTTRSISVSERWLWNGSARVRRATESVMGRSQGVAPNRCTI